MSLGAADVTVALYLDHPSPRTALAKVTATAPGAFVLDKSIFHPGTVAQGHPQPADRGYVWLGGDKRWLKAVDWRRDQLLHRLEGATPRVGAEVRCHLDVERREETEAAHTALHLVLSRLARPGDVPEGRVLGGRRFRIDVARHRFSAQGVADALAIVQSQIDTNLQITVEHVLASRAQTDAGSLVAAGDQDRPVRIVRIGTVSAWPCEGTFRPRTLGLGRVVLEAARPRGGMMELRFQVRAP